MYPILKATENACAQLALTASVSASLNVNIYTGIDNETVDAPAVICFADSAREEFPNSGVWHVNTRIYIKEMAADTSVTSSLSDTIFKAFMSDVDTVTSLNLYPNYYVYDMFSETAENGSEGDAWSQQYVFDIVCSTKQ